jgi:hypothetical protein
MTTNLVKVPLSDGQRGRSACAIDTAQSCTYCGNRIGIPECPEWTAGEGKAEQCLLLLTSTSYTHQLTISGKGNLKPVQKLSNICGHFYPLCYRRHPIWLDIKEPHIYVSNRLHIAPKGQISDGKITCKNEI